MSAARPTFSKRALATGVAGVAALAVFALPATSQDATSDVHIVHGIPDTPVDVYVDGTLTLEDFQPGTRTPAVPLAPGNYNIDVTAPDGDPATEAVIDQTVTVPDPDLDIDLVAHLDESGTPLLTAFVNDESVLAGGEGRLTVRHTASAPTVDVLADGSNIVDALSNPDDASLDLPAATYPNVQVVADADNSVVAIELGDVELPAATQLYVYAVGNLADETITAYAFAETNPATFSRVAGATRIETAAAISARAFPDGSDVVYIANAFTVVDAVAGGVLHDGPILVVPQCGELPAAVEAEIQRLGATQVLGLGGSAAICDELLAAAGAATS